MSRPRALMLAHRIPYPPDKGDKIRSWRLLTYLADRYDVALGCFIDDDDDWQHTEKVASICAETCFRPLKTLAANARSAKALVTGDPITLARYRDGALATWVAGEQARGPAVQVGFSAGVMPYLWAGSAPVLADLCDADSAKWSAYGQNAAAPKSWIYAREGRLLAKTEAEVTRRAARTFLVTPEEAALVAGLPGADRARVDHYRNGVDTDYFAPGATAPQPDGADIVLTGAMDYRPNAEGAQWFVRQVLPRLRDSHPDATFAIVGARPTRAVERLADQAGVTVTGRVPDVRPWLERARVAIAPLGVARGVQNKVLEAMAMGTPLVASAAALEGTQAVAGEHALTAETPDDVADAVATLLRDPARAEALGQAARAFAADHFGWDAALARLGDALPR